MSYIYVKAPPEYPGKVYSFGKRILEHHLVWWKNTGEVVPEGYVIHHKDENTHNNAFSNLEKLLHGEHTSKHHTVHSIVDYVCICGITFQRSTRVLKSEQAYCSNSCSAKSTRNRGVSEETILKIKKFRQDGLSSYTISSELGVSRNTVMKYW